MVTTVGVGGAAHEDLTLEVLEPTAAAPPRSTGAIVELFRASYHRYHYLDEVAAAGKHRIVVRIDDRLVGYGTVKRSGRFGVLSNLVVDAAHRGRGIGSAIEAVRSAICRSAELIPYSSCVTVGTQSQSLKIVNGLDVINVKYGYRSDVYRPGEVTSAATLSRYSAMAPGPVRDAVLVDAKNRRVRVVAVSKRAVADGIAAYRSASATYVDVLVPYGLAAELRAHPALSFRGIDCIPADGVAGALFQLDNDVQRRGRAGRNDLAVPDDAVTQRGWDWIARHGAHGG